jgi:hypothetical protein
LVSSQVLFKRNVIREALGIAKKGGAFVFHDLVFAEKFYGESGEPLNELRGLDPAKVNPVNTGVLDCIPSFLRTPFMPGGIGLLYGEQ